MKAYIHKLYDEILCKEQSNDIIISGASSLKVIILIVSKLLNQILITITSIFKENPDISSKTVCIVLTQNQMRSVSPLVDILFSCLGVFLGFYIPSELHN